MRAAWPRIFLARATSARMSLHYHRFKKKLKEKTDPVIGREKK